MLEYPVSHLKGQVEAPAIFLEYVNNSKTLLEMVKPSGIYLAKYIFSCVAEWSMAEVMAQRDGLGKVLIQTQGFCYCSRYLGDFKGMGKPCPVMVPFR